LAQSKSQLDTAVPQLSYVGPQLPSGFFTRKKPPHKTLVRARELWNRSKRYTFAFSLSVRRLKRTAFKKPEILRAFESFIRDSGPLQQGENRCSILSPRASRQDRPDAIAASRAQAQKEITSLPQLLPRCPRGPETANRSAGSPGIQNH